MRKRLIVPSLVVLLALAMAGPAWAKGPKGATITGPGISEPIVIEGSGEFSNGSDFSKFIEATGFWHLVFGAEGIRSDMGETVAAPPSTDLGPAYVVTWHVVRNRVEADVYPHADGGPLVFVEPGITIEDFDTETVGGWFAAQPILLDLMAGYGVPVTTPSTPVPVKSDPKPALDARATEAAETAAPSTSAPGLLTLPVIILIVITSGAGVWWAARRRPRRVSVP